MNKIEEIIDWAKEPGSAIGIMKANFLVFIFMVSMSKQNKLVWPNPKLRRYYFRRLYNCDEENFMNILRNHREKKG